MAETNSVRTTSQRLHVKVADEVWIAAALLHRERPTEPDFAIEEIVSRAAKEGLVGSLRPGLYVHIVQHCVANRAPNPGRYRMLFETGPGRRRLFRKGDPYHPAREGGKIMPNQNEIPGESSDLLGWYADWSSTGQLSAAASDPLLTLEGSGERLWSREHGDDYVRRLRQDWQ